MSGEQPAPSLIAGTVLLAVPALVAVDALDKLGSRQGLAGAASVPLAALALLLGMVALVLTAAWPRRMQFPFVVVACAVLAMLVLPVTVLPAAVCGPAILVFLLAAQLRAAAQRYPAPAREWLAEWRPLLLGAAVATPGAVSAAALPASWSLSATAAFAAIIATLCTVVLVPLRQE